MTRLNWMKIYLPVFALAATLLTLSGCGSGSEQAAETDGDKPLKVVCTTGIIGDAVGRVAGDKIDLSSLMGPGVDPHLYKATQGDLKKLTDADLIFYNGLHLEGKMGEVLEKLARLKPVHAVADGIPEADLLMLPGKVQNHDPHIWFDVATWSKCVQQIAKVLAEVDPANKDVYAKNAEAYLQELSELHNWVAETVQTIPESQRVMVTAHDAFSYFSRAYGMEVRGLQGISTVAEFGLQDRIKLVDFITERQIKAVFVESSVPSKSIEAVIEGCAQKDHQVVIGGTLFADAMGDPNTPEGTYPGMVRANVNTIVQALK